MEQSLIQFRVDSALKNEVTEIYKAIGLDLPTALRMFLVRSKMMRGLPFEANLPSKFITHQQALEAFEELREQAADVPEMTFDEINEEIALMRAERKARKGK